MISDITLMKGLHPSDLPLNDTGHSRANGDSWDYADHGSILALYGSDGQSLIDRTKH